MLCYRRFYSFHFQKLEKLLQPTGLLLLALKALCTPCAVCHYHLSHSKLEEEEEAELYETRPLSYLLKDLPPSCYATTYSTRKNKTTDTVSPVFISAIENWTLILQGKSPIFQYRLEMEP